jgi:membrane protease YdiL (CAAX protease family)
VNPILILTSITGFILSILLTWAIFKIAQRALHIAISTEIKVKEEQKKVIEFEVETTSPIKSYLRKDIVSSTRDIQSFMFIFFPIFYPLILVFSMTGLFTEVITTTFGILIAWSALLLVYLFIPIMLVVGLLNLEESGSSTLASLPIVPRDQAKAKIILMLSIQAISLTLTAIVLTLMLNSLLIILLLLISLPIAWSLLLFMFLLKIKLFGQMKYKYILEELNKEHKVLKWIAMILSMVGFYLAIVIIGTILISVFDLTTALITIGIVGIIEISILIFAFNRMFPKVEKMAAYKTGGFLREHVNTSTFILLLLFFIFSFFPSIVLNLIGPLLQGLSFTAGLFIQFFLEMGFFALLWFVAVPYGLKLPNGKETFNQFSSSIGLNKFKPLLKNLLIGIFATAILLISVLAMGMLFGTYVFAPELLFSDPNPLFLPSLLSLGWFRLVYMLRPGIWEEVAFRGVILNLQKKKYKQTAIVFLNGILFGLFHLTNLISFPNSLEIYLQAFYASCIGIAFSYIYVKTNNLLPCIITHYLFDAFIVLFATYDFPNLINYIFYKIIGIGIVPTILIVLMVYLISKKGNFRLKPNL